MDIAQRVSEMSHAVRAHVGAIIVKDGRIISIGWNGMPSGWDNICEEDFETKKEVLHAEPNAIAKLAKSNESGDGATIYCTHSPCIDCAKLIYQSGINKLLYNEDYNSNDGLEFLKKCNVEIVNMFDRRSVFQFVQPTDSKMHPDGKNMNQVYTQAKQAKAMSPQLDFLNLFKFSL